MPHRMARTLGLILMLGLTGASLPARSAIYPGGWRIPDRTLLEGDTLEVWGPLTVVAGGQLVLEACRLTMHDLGANPGAIRVQPSGFIDLTGCTLDAAEGSRYDLVVQPGAGARVVDCTIRNAGWKDQHGTDECRWVGPPYTNDTSTGGHGLEFRGDLEAFCGNTLVQVVSARFFGSGLLIADNVIEGIGHEGLAFFGDDCEVCRNTIRGDVRFDRESYGLRFYPGTRRHRVHHNEISQVGCGIMVANVSPWDPGLEFEIHHNSIHHVFKGCLAALADTRIHHETYRNFISKGLMLLVFENVTVDSCRITDGTFVAPELVDPHYYAEVKTLCHPRASQTYWDHEMRRGAVMLMGGSDNLVLGHNYFARFPRSGCGITMDIVKTADNIRIEHNVFENIGFIELAGDPLTRRAPRIASIAPVYGLGWVTEAAIEVEQVDHLLIAGNTFRDCRTGVTTIFPDGLGHAGDTRIADNSFALTDSMAGDGTGRLLRHPGWPSTRERIPPVGILLTAHFASTPQEKIAKARRTPDRQSCVAALIRYLETPHTYRVYNNRIVNYAIPLVLHADPRTWASPVTFEVTGNYLEGFARCYLPEGFDLEANGNTLLRRR